MDYKRIAVLVPILTLTVEYSDALSAIFEAVGSLGSGELSHLT